MARLCGGTLGLFAFSITIFVSLSASNPIEATIGRALTAMFAFCGVGLAVGWIAGRVLDEYAVGRNRELFGEEEAGSEASPAAAAGEEAGG